MDMEFTNGQMEVFTKETGTKTRFQNMESITGTMEELIKDTGLIIICMVMEFTNGLTEGNMKVNI